jgi:hypothetical protein
MNRFIEGEAAATEYGSTRIVEWTSGSEGLMGAALDYKWCPHPSGEEGVSCFVYPATGGRGAAYPHLWVKTLSFSEMVRVAVMTGRVPFGRWFGNTPLCFVGGSFHAGKLCGFDYRNTIATVNRYRVDKGGAYVTALFGCNTLLVVRRSLK